MHYRITLAGEVESEVDDPGFFLAPHGKSYPESELEATLRFFFRDDLVGRSQQPARCAFVARYEWLKRQLEFDETQFPIHSCDRFEQWFTEFHAQSVTLIFASAFMNNPSSMFGHTFLRIDQEGQTPETRILAYTINYSADVPPDAGIAFAYKGITGMYRGYFSTIPYYLKVKEYRDFENRDLWEYQLNLSEEQITNLLRHAWELGNAYFDYYFFKENCAYHLLSLLEIANPALRLTEEFSGWTIPADTVRLLTSQPGLVGDIIYRPSRSTQILRQRELFSQDDNQWLLQIVENPAEIQVRSFQSQPISTKIKILDLASDYLRYKTVDVPDEASLYRELTREVLLARSQLKQPSLPPFIEPFTLQPESGHDTSRVSVGVGWREDETFEELAIRGAYHDLLDPETGYTPGAQIEIFGLHMRHYARRNQLRVERFTLLDILSLSPIDRLFRAPSWKIKIGHESLRHGTCRYCSSGNLNGGAGAAVQWSGIGTPTFFGFGEIDANVSTGFQRNHRIGGGSTIGMLANPHPRWGVLITATYLHFPIGERSDDTRIFFGQRLTISQNLTARLEYRHRRDDNDVVFSVQAFF
ncbi:DUF4105 domain-containing protein [Candidatus Nitronereus thalassa]|uniref:DUF4105 domain-containing protein n=1 Tax=Candidatus Nitronereus thalassa TaxID=3020898 RepID=A0ABU3K8B4_9BACT|nr:DUF4105 domain-containing protein [Candidatus Nitronereus thalassa]MDT7042583.1 DUF4105 domain-containing protein [Candidatus Nitronereus thalassa]